MLDLTLRDQLFHFVKTFRVVREDQIISFFSDRDNDDVRHEINRLLARSWLYRLRDIYIAPTPKLPAPLKSYDSHIEAIDVLCWFRSCTVDWILQMEYPIDIMFGTTANEIYDVTSFGVNWQAKASLIPMIRQRQTVEGEDDVVKHVAVVHDPSLVHKLANYGFSFFFIIQPDGTLDGPYAAE